VVAERRNAIAFTRFWANSVTAYFLHRTSSRTPRLSILVVLIEVVDVIAR
jgi:hypothetical protein